MAEKIIRNSACCLKCGDEIESTHRHDLRSCSCGSLAVDGGQAYLRRVGDAIGDGTWQETSIVEKEGEGE